MKLVKDHITLEELKPMADKMERKLVKAVLDVELGIMVVDAPMHVDQECYLLEDGSEQGNLWGINIFPYKKMDSDEFIEFDSMINLRPSWGNRSRGVDDPEVQKKIKKMVYQMVVEK